MQALFDDELLAFPELLDVAKHLMWVVPQES